MATFVNSSNFAVAFDPNMAEREASRSNVKQITSRIEAGNNLIGVHLWFTMRPKIVIIGEIGVIKAHPNPFVRRWLARVDTHIGESPCLPMQLSYSLCLIRRTHGCQKATFGSFHNGLEKIKFIKRTIVIPRVLKS